MRHATRASAGGCSRKGHMPVAAEEGSLPRDCSSKRVYLGGR